jgi:hypothetical protein
MADYWKALEKGISFGINPRRWLQFFILHAVFFCIGLSIAFPMLAEIVQIIATNPQNMMAMLSVAGSALSLIAVFIVWALASLWLSGAMVHQSHKEKDSIGRSLGVSGRGYVSMLLAMIIVGLISAAVGVVPVIGTVLVFMFSAIFFFILQGVILSNLGFASSIENSWDIFRKNINKFRASFRSGPFVLWLILVLVLAAVSAGAAMSAWMLAPVALLGWISASLMVTLIIYSRIFRIYVILAIVSFIIFGIFMIPAAMLFFAYFGTQFLAPAAYTGERFTGVLVQAMESGMAYFIVSGAVAIVGISISQAFALKAQTEFYKQLKKKL